MPTNDEIKNRIMYALSVPYQEGITTTKLGERIGVKSSTEWRKFYAVLRSLKKHKKYKKVETLSVGRKVVNYLPENEELVKRKWGMEEESKEVKGNEYLELRISHTNDVQEEVIKPLYEAFKKVRYNWDTPRFEGDERGFAEAGPPFFVVYMGKGKGREVIIYDIVEGTVLLDDFREYHAPVLSKMMDEFNEKYREYWVMYFEIHQRIREIIKRRTGLPITQYHGVIKGSTKRVDSVTTNLQYWLYHALLSYRMFKDSKIWDISFSNISRIKKCGKMYEYWLQEGCCFRVEYKGRGEDVFRNETTEKIKRILMDIGSSTKLLALSGKIRNLEYELWELQYGILRYLERELKKEVLDGICEYVIPRKEVKRKKGKEDFKFDLLHKYYHEGLRE